jgi:hypothetical protein
VWLWLCYLFTPLAPFYTCGGGCLDHNDEIRIDMYQLKENLSIDLGYQMDISGVCGELILQIRWRKITGFSDTKTAVMHSRRK